MQVFAYSQRGIGKVENEDRIIIGHTVLSNGFLETEYFGGPIAIADGVGGNSAGAVASHYLATKLSEMNFVDEHVLKKLNAELVLLSEQDSNLHGMASTLSGLTFKESAMSVFHAGNTRIYSLSQRGYLRRITKDDTVVRFLIESGQLTEEQAQTFERRNEITTCFGGGKNELLQLKMFDEPLQSKALLLTCDGIHDYISDDQIEELINSCGGDYYHALQELVSFARDAGSEDDVSVIYVE